MVVLIMASPLLAETPNNNTVALTLPGLTWALEIEAPGFEVQEKELAPEGKAARFDAENDQTDTRLSAFLEKAPTRGSALECRQHYWSRARQSPFKKDQIKMSETNSMALVEYIVREHLGRKVNQKNFNA